MEGFQNWLGKIKEDLKAASEKASSSSSSSSSSSASFKAPDSNEGLSAVFSGQSRISVAKPVRVGSLWTCSKFCAIAFVAGIIVGYTLKRRVKRWANKLLKKIRDD